MRRFVTLVALLALVVALLTGAGVMAQEATPVAEPLAGTPVPARIRTLASGSIEVLAPGIATIGLGRITLAPGGTLPFVPNDPSADLVSMQSGELTFRIAAPMTVVRGAGRGTPVPAEPEAVAANTAFTLRAGDSALFPPAAAGEVRNDSAEAATAWVVSLSLFREDAGTPTP